jgi:SAM-dependent methyltransferase
MDLAAEFVAVAQTLTELTRLSDKVSFPQGDALDIPFGAATFDVVWSQNTAMSIADRPRLYTGIRRVRRPGGRHALSDIVRGDGGEPYHPTPWAPEASASYPLTEEVTRPALEHAGFEVVAWENTTAQAVEGASQRAPNTNLPSLGLHLLFGEHWPAIAANVLRNYRERKIGVIQGVVRRLD